MNLIVTDEQRKQLLQRAPRQFETSQGGVWLSDLLSDLSVAIAEVERLEGVEKTLSHRIAEVERERTVVEGERDLAMHQRDRALDLAEAAVATRIAAWRARDAAVERLARVEAALAKEHTAIENILGRALRYPRYCDDQKNFPGTTDADGVCVGEHVPETLAAEAAAKIADMEKGLGEAAVSINSLYCDIEALQKRTAGLEAELAAAEVRANDSWEAGRARERESGVPPSPCRCRSCGATIACGHWCHACRAGGEDEMAARVSDMERRLSAGTAHEKALSLELEQEKEWREAAVKTILRKDKRIAELGAELKREKQWREATAKTLKREDALIADLVADARQNRLAWASLPGLPQAAPAPTTRLLTTAERLPEVGDVIAYRGGPWRCSWVSDAQFIFVVDGERGAHVLDADALRTYALHYLSRADGGPVTVEVQP